MQTIQTACDEPISLERDQVAFTRAIQTRIVTLSIRTELSSNTLSTNNRFLCHISERFIADTELFSS